MFRSLRAQLFLPVVVTALAASLIVAWASRALGERRAIDQMLSRYRSIEATVADASFPLTAAVLDSLSRLTGTEWATLDRQGSLLSATLQPVGSGSAIRRLGGGLGLMDELTSPATRPRATQVTISGRTFSAFAFARRGAAAVTDRVATVVILFDRDEIARAARDAATPPLVAGLSTVTLLSLLMLVIPSRIVARLRRLDGQLRTIAAGDFDSRLTDSGSDEIGALAARINAMAVQLKQLWRQVHRQQGVKLLHQLAGGMAHQLRNTLTGARLAMEMHQSQSGATQSEEVSVALDQLETAERYVARLLSVAAGTEGPPRPMRVIDCLRDVRATHRAVANHLGVTIDWRIDDRLGDRFVADGPAFAAAVSNLVLNAMQAGRHVCVEAPFPSDGDAANAEGHLLCELNVSDDGPGIDPAVADNLYEPFVTSKPEGVGLGLPLVRRVAERLGGSIRVERSSDRTRFHLAFRAETEADACESSNTEE